ncbi:MAG: FtsX-like permease family protein [Cyclobacteriaceae bacterium]
MQHLLTVGEKRIVQKGYYVSEEFLEMFEYELLHGSPDIVLDDPKSIVITETLAGILFPGEDPINKTVRVNDEGNLKVTGVLKDLPTNSSMEFEFLMTWKYRESISPWVVRNSTNWGNYSFQVYVELNNDEDEVAVEERIKTMLAENGEDDIPRELYLHPLLRWRLHSNFENGKEAGGMSDYVQLFTAIAFLIILIACINFMNLATARSERRAREVGIRKSLGSNRGQLISQFFGESIIISFLAFVFAILLAQLALPAYNNLVEKQLFIDYSSLQFWMISLAAILLTGIIAGSYPALYLSSFSPIKTLKGRISTGKNASTPRKVLVILQFGFSIILMISTVVIIQQIDLVKNRELGYKQDNLISVYWTDQIQQNWDVLKQDLLQSGAVESVTSSNSEITQINSNNFLGWPGKPENLRVIFTTIAANYDYCQTMGIKVLQGRDFSDDFTSDTSSIVINKAALDLMGLEDPIGTNLDLWGGKKKLIGVVDDVLMGSPYEEVKPMFMIMDPDWVGVVTIRLKAGMELEQSLATVEDVFDIHNSAYPFEYRFADAEFEQKFATINLTIKLSTLFAILAAIITGLGLFGLASYMAEQRTKEIGIRKVLGASIMSLVSLMSKDFSKLVIVAFLLAAPFSWYILSLYLERYPIHVNIQWWIFPVTGLLALVFALGIVSNQARRAAAANPVQSLRTE